MVIDFIIIFYSKMYEILCVKYIGFIEKLSFDINWKKKYILRLNYYLKLIWKF